MIVTCEHCGARYKLDPARITGRGVRITCPRCKNVFAVYRQPDEAGAPEDPAEAAAAPPDPAQSVPQPAAARQPAATDRPDVSELDFASVGIQAWKVKVAIGLVYDFSDYKTLARYIKDGRVGEGDRISHDGKTWTVLGEIPDLEEHFHQVYEQAKARSDEGEDAFDDDSFNEDSPTMIVGAASLAGTLGNTANLGQRAAPAVEADTGALGIAAAMQEAADDQGEVVIGASSPKEPAGPRFHDPFARARAERSSGARRQRRAEPARPAPATPGGGRRLLGVIAIGAVLGVVGVGAWVAFSQQQQQAALEVQRAEAAREAALAAQKKLIDESVKENLENDIKTGIAEGLEETDPIDFGEDDEDVLIPVGPTGGTASRGGSANTVTAAVAGGTMTTSATTPQDHYDAGVSALSRADYTTAVKALQAAVAGDPGNALYHEKLGLAYYQSGDANSAVRELRTATSRGAVNAWNYLGDILAAQGDDAGAIAAWTEYLKHKPNDTDVQSKINGLTN